MPKSQSEVVVKNSKKKLIVIIGEKDHLRKLAEVGRGLFSGDVSTTHEARRAVAVL